ncbi:MAG: 16S rRNA (cytidine(1402)-2'-O)-methyltransferase [SAR202 cluster bacterium]|nr:16S rRNA (cytidine(1402)-2'-O)-methyltransferase [SAR202 cluster bacterium]
MSNLYVVSTPIGNLGDLSKRAIDTFAQVGLIVAEDTRVTKKILSHLKIQTPLLSFNDHNAIDRIPEILNHLLNYDIALTTDAGTPGVSDPGNLLVDAIRSQGHSIISIPGPSAVTSAISICPFSIKRFLFLGFPNKNTKDNLDLIKQSDLIESHTIFFESPLRILGFLKTINDTSPNRLVFIAREITKIHEETFTGTAEECIKYLKTPKGEFTIILNPIKVDKISNHKDLIKIIHKLHMDGLKTKEIAREISTISHITSGEAYKLILDNLKGS